MAARRSPDGSVEFLELSSDDPPATRAFLQEVFVWKFRATPMPGGDYLSAETPGGGRGGIRRTQATESPSSLNYIRVRDLGAALARVTKAGGEVVLPRVDVPQMGSFFWFRAPGGPILACWQDLPSPGPGGEKR